MNIFNFRLSQSGRAFLKRIADETDSTMSDVVRVALALVLNDPALQQQVREQLRTRHR